MATTRAKTVLARFPVSAAARCLCLQHKASMAVMWSSQMTQQWGRAAAHQHLFKEKRKEKEITKSSDFSGNCGLVSQMTQCETGT